MRQTQIFSGSSHPELVESICDRLGLKPGEVDLGKFSNGETRVQIRTSIRNQDVFIVQSGSNKINDSLIELLIMCSACKGGSAKSITAVMPYFPYSRQSKKKSHRGAITARMVSNLLDISGVDHVITLDLHGTEMQGFFKCPVDNLVAEPLIARWIKHNIPNWKEGVVVSKNPGGTKRVTSLADALKLNFGIVTTDSRRVQGHRQTHSVDYSESATPYYLEEYDVNDEEYGQKADDEEKNGGHSQNDQTTQVHDFSEGASEPARPTTPRRRNTPTGIRRNTHRSSSGIPASPLSKTTLPGNSPDGSPSLDALVRTRTEPPAPPSFEEDQAEEFLDERARDVTVGRLIHGHIVPDNHPSPAFSAAGSMHGSIYRTRGPVSENGDAERFDPMTASFMSTASSLRHEPSTDQGLGGSADAAASSEEEEEDLQNPDLETTVTLVGNVRARPVFIVDDIIDKSGSWIAAAETVVKRGGATKVYCIATHGLFGEDSLWQLQDCDCIDTIVVTNSFPIDAAKKAGVTKLVQLDVAPLLGEAIRRNYHGENLSQLYMHFDD